MAIVTTKYKDAAVYGLNVQTWDQYFDVVIGSDEVNFMVNLIQKHYALPCLILMRQKAI